MHKLFLRARIVVPFVLAFLFIIEPPFSALAAEINLPPANNSARTEASAQKPESAQQEAPTLTPVRLPSESTSTEGALYPTVPTSQSAPELAKPAQEPRVPSYMRMMRDLRAQKEDKQVTPENTQKVAGDLKRFIQSEKDRLSKFDIPNARVRNYLNSLESTHQGLDPTPKTFREKLGSLWDAAKDAVLGLFESSDDTKHSPLAVPAGEPRIPKQPSGFRTNDEKIEVKSFAPGGISVPVGQKVSRALQNIAKITTVYADVTAPMLAEVQGNGEAPVNNEIKKIARDLHNNPVAIMNFVRNLARYEPYYGAKKGALGCLQEKVCNDVDASSLVVSLMRAAGIPARYQKTFALFPVEQLQNLLSVDNTKAAFAALYRSKVPVYTIESANNGKTIDTADFSLETQLAVEWTVPEIFYDYDERGGNIENTMHLESATTDQELQTAVAPYPKKQWLPVEVLVKLMTHTKKEILADTAGFDSKAFWDGFLQYQGDSTIVEKYRNDLLSATGKNIDDYQSTVSFTQNNLSRLPVTLPYVRAIGAVNGVQVLPEKFAVVPDARRMQVKISLRKSADNATVFEKTFFASEVNNKDIQLGYTGATEADNQVIDSYGGIAGTPSALVSLIPFVDVPDDYASYNGSAPVKIGDALVLQFLYTQNGATVYSDEKFSVAGNKEGIVMVFSRVQSDPSQDSDSNILLHGETGLAREYLKRGEAQSALIGGSLDYSSHIMVSRAVVTENRVLGVQNGVPTTFDFKGLSIDASVFINDYSNRGDFKTHLKDFRLLWGAAMSHLEGRLFEDVTGLESISTVKGLQYAYGKPAEYTMHTIASANESDIDTLQFSANTKTVMHAGVQKGNTIITPQKPVNKGNWTGILYISLDPEWTGTYAIGEQAMQNGGDTTMSVALKEVPEAKIASWVTDAKKTVENVMKDVIFSYTDKPASVLSVTCSIEKTVSDQMVASNDWKLSYGEPCAKATKTYGLISHTYLLASYAAKFYSPNKYEYWTTFDSAKNILENDKNKDNVDNISGIKLDGEFKFNPIAGTFSQSGHYGFPSKMITAYYEPTADQVGRGHVVYDDGKFFGDILSKLQEPHYAVQTYYCPSTEQDPNEYCKKQNWVLNKLGYPTGNRQEAAPHVVNWGLDTTGYYQNFAGGQIYFVTIGWKDTFYVPAQIQTYYEDSQFAINGKIGSGGQFGFPVEDPHYKNNGYELKQGFENGEGIVWNKNTNLATIEFASKYYCDEIDTKSNAIVGEALLHGLWEGGGAFMKGMIVFGVVTAVAGTALDVTLGTHGGATIAAWAALGTGVAVAVKQVVDAGVDNVLNGVDQRVQYEIKHSACLARSTYLFGKYVPEFIAFVLGMKNLAKQTPEALKGISLSQTILTASKSDVLPMIKNAFAENIKVFLPIMKKGQADLDAIVDAKQSEFVITVANATKAKNSALTMDELTTIASQQFGNGAKDLVKFLGWKKLPNQKLPFDESDTFANFKPPLNMSKFIVTDGKIRTWEQNGSVKSVSGNIKVVIKDGKVSYFKPGYDSFTKLEESHAKLVQGASVDGAYTIYINNQHQLESISPFSGHYETPFERIKLLEYFLKISGVDTSKMKVMTWSEYEKMYINQ